MSPIDPISPVSPIMISSNEASPATPTGEPCSFQCPPAPMTDPILHLPRLITSFNTCANISHIRKSSTQFKLPTPSPLNLTSSQTPQTAIRWAFSPCHKRRGAISGSHIDRSKPLSPMSSILLPEFDTSQQQVDCLLNSCLEQQELVAERRHANSKHIDVDTITPTRRQGIELAFQVKSVQNCEHLSTKVTNAGSFDADDQPLPKTTGQYAHKYSRSLIRKRRKSKSPTGHRLQRRSVSSQTHTRQVPALIIRTPKEIHLANSIIHLSTPLVPLISVRTGISHPDFPRCLLQYHLLTHEQLDSLARWYHQTLDSDRERWMYPAPIQDGKAWAFSDSISEAQRQSLLRRESITKFDLDLETKRRRWGRFIGLKGCDSPVDEDGNVLMEDQQATEEEDLIERMEREWREALRRAEDEYRLRDKFWKGRF